MELVNPPPRVQEGEEEKEKEKAEGDEVAEKIGELKIDNGEKDVEQKDEEK